MGENGRGEAQNEKCAEGTKNERKEEKSCIANIYNPKKVQSEFTLMILHSAKPPDYQPKSRKTRIPNNTAQDASWYYCNFVERRPELRRSSQCAMRSNWNFVTVLCEYDVYRRYRKWDGNSIEQVAATIQVMIEIPKIHEFDCGVNKIFLKGSLMT